MPEKKRRSEWTFQDWLEYETSSKHTFYKASDGYWCFNTAECLCSRASENRDEAARLSVEYACDTKGLPLAWLPDIEPPQTISECLEMFAENGFEVSIQIARNDVAVTIFHHGRGNTRDVLAVMQEFAEKYC